MAKKKTASGGMNRTERVAGTIFFLVYLLVMPASAPRMTVLIVVLLAPFVEEVLFRGLVFGCLKEKSRIFAYILSCALFAFLHVWTAAVSNWDLGYLILMLQYLVPGLVFAWAYEHSGTLWTSILLHMLVNALSLFTIAS